MTDFEQQLVRVMDVGGSHVTAAIVNRDVVETKAGRAVDPHGSAESILAAWADAGRALDDGASAAHDAWWAIAMPDPFDFEHGRGPFENVGKFEQLANVDLRGELAERLQTEPDRVRFVHDAGAYAIGEFAYGEARGHDRAVCITLGTGVGSAFLDHGTPVTDHPGIPTNGTVHLLRFDGRPLEDTVSTRAIIADYGRRSGEAASVKTIAERARAGNLAAQDALNSALFALGVTLAPALDAFEATVLVVGGAISQAWNILEAPFRAGLAEAHPTLESSIQLRASLLLDEAPLLGAAYWLTHL